MFQFLRLAATGILVCPDIHCRDTLRKVIHLIFFEVFMHILRTLHFTKKQCPAIHENSISDICIALHDSSQFRTARKVSKEKQLSVSADAKIQGDS
ncbi:hypothetical protein T08_9689 [Trichinella sp. T8]|nr:hypothetical protein T08_9689 [Trichinella sp. T8]